MRIHLLSLATIGAFALAAGSASAAPVKLNKVQLDNVVAGTGYCVCCPPPTIALKGNNGYGQEKHGAPVDPLPPGAAHGSGASAGDKPSSFGVR